MHATINAAHEAYRQAAELAPERPDDQPIDVAWRYADAPSNHGFPVRGSHLAAAAGAILSLVAGGLCGALLP